jgi:hypothetical protein
MRAHLRGNQRTNGGHQDRDGRRERDVVVADPHP